MLLEEGVCYDQCIFLAKLFAKSSFNSLPCFLRQIGRKEAKEKLPWPSPERLLLNHAKTWGFLAPGGNEFNPGPERRLDHSELLCNKVLLKYKGDRESV